MGALRRFLGLEVPATDGAKAVTDWDPRVPFQPLATYTPASRAFFPDVSIDPARVYRDFHAVRTVVDFAARNVSSVPLHVYERASDTDRRRVTSGPLVDALRSPAPGVTQMRLLGAVVRDSMLYDRWLMLKVRQPDGSVRLLRLTPTRWVMEVDTFDVPRNVRVLGRDGWEDVDPAKCVFGFGYAPAGGAGTPPMQAISDLIGELQLSAEYRSQLYANGARVPAWLEVPPEARDAGFDQARFDAEWYARFTGPSGSRAGGAPTLHDGVKLHETRAFSPGDLEQATTRQLTLAEAAAAFHIAPELVGARPGNYSNVREYRKALFGDTLGPIITDIEQALNSMLVPDLDDTGRLYVEANVEAKLRGSFEEQAQILQAAVGAPWMTRAEARGRANLPELDEADGLVVPLNVLVGGQASPRDSGDQNRGLAAVAPGVLRLKADGVVPERLRVGYAAEVASFVERQRAAVMSALGAKATPPLADAWDADRWDRELAAVIFRHMRRSAEVRAAEVAEALGVDDFDPDVMLGWLAAAGRNAATAWNAATYDTLADAVRDGEWKESVAAVFAAAASARAVYLATTTTTEAANFGATEAAVRGGMTMKTWVVTSGNPRSTHAAMNGETVAVGEVFSNGARWPGDHALPEEERANCRCEIEFRREG